MDNADINISLADIAKVKSILELASQRGAFQANELSYVGEVYDKISLWLSSVASNTDSSDQGESND